MVRNNIEYGSTKKRNSGRFSRRNFVQTVGAGITATSVAGCLGDDEEGLTVGFLGPLDLDDGVGGARAAELAVDEINEEGGILDEEVELITADSVAVPAEARVKVEEMIQDDNIDALFGGYVSEVALGIIDTVADANVPWLVTGAGTPLLTTEHHAQDYERYKNVFRVMSGNSDLQAEAQAAYAEHLNDLHGWTDFAIVTENAAWTAPTADNLPDLLEDRGLNVVLEERVELDTTDFTPLLDAVEASDADAMLKEVGLMDVAGLLQEWGESEYPFAQEGLNLLSLNPEFWDDTGGNCLYETTAWWGGGGAVNVTEHTGDFINAYQERWDTRPRVPVIMGLATYDAVNIYRNAVEAVGSADYENDLDEIVGELQATSHVGVSGRIEFFPPDAEYPNDVKTGPDYLPFTALQWQEDNDGGSRECVFPEEHLTSEHTVPPWM